MRKWHGCICLNIYSLTCSVRDQNLGRNLTFLVVCGESWSETASWLSFCLHRLLTIVSLAADLVHQDCIISGRMAKVHSHSTKTVCLKNQLNPNQLPVRPYATDLIVQITCTTIRFSFQTDHYVKILLELTNWLKLQWTETTLVVVSTCNTNLGQNDH